MLHTIDLLLLTTIAKRAGAAIMDIYKQPFEVEVKADNSPLTLADKAANDIIIQGLTKHYPSIPYISEEVKQTDYLERKNWDWCWLIDPLDGTKEFVKKNGEFTVNIALIHKGKPVAGVVYVPATDTLYYAKKGTGSYKQVASKVPKRIFCTPLQANKTVIIFASRSHRNEATNNFIEQVKVNYPKVQVTSCGSSLKLCLIAEGKVHLYPRYAPTMEWDTAAAHAVVNEAGANVYQQGTRLPLVYNKANLLNPYFLVTAGEQKA